MNENSNARTLPCCICDNPVEIGTHIECDKLAGGGKTGVAHVECYQTKGKQSLAGAYERVDTLFPQK